MKQTSILLKPQLAQAAHDGDKTMTRRVIKDQDLSGAPKGGFDAYSFQDPETSKYLFGFESDDDTWICPYGKPGDFLYVKEEHYTQGWWKAGGFTKTGKVKQTFIDKTDDVQPVLFPFNKPKNICTGRSDFGYYKRNSLFMPKSIAGPGSKSKEYGLNGCRIYQRTMRLLRG